MAAAGLGWKVRFRTTAGPWVSARTMPELHTDLGTALAKLGRFREAVPEFETALRLDPHLDAAKHNLQAARARLEQAGEREAIR